MKMKRMKRQDYFKSVAAQSSQVGFKIGTMSPKREIGLALANLVRNEINAGVCHTRSVDPSIVVEQLDGLALRRFKARLKIKKYRSKIGELNSFYRWKFLTEAQCDYVESLVKHYKTNFASKMASLGK